MSSGATVPGEDPLPHDRRTPHPDRLSPDTPGHAAILAAHERALDVEDEGYVDPTTGFFVFTAATLWDRGYCCDSGCRHCPWHGRPSP